MSPLPWLHRVALNLCYSRPRPAARVGAPIDDATSEGLRTRASSPPSGPSSRSSRCVRDGIAALHPKHRSVVVLYYLHGLSLQETSTVLGVRLGTVKSRLHYGLLALRRQLASETWAPADGPAAVPVERPVRPRRP